MQLGMFYKDSEAEIQEAYKYAQQIIKDLGITKNTLQRDAIEKINNFICEQKAYNYDFARDTSIKASIKRDVGVCLNYATEFQILCLVAGIECYQYHSTEMNHV